MMNEMRRLAHQGLLPPPNVPVQPLQPVFVIGSRIKIFKKVFLQSKGLKIFTPWRFL
jgi:hypothetical protein